MRSCTAAGFLLTVYTHGATQWQEPCNKGAPRPVVQASYTRTESFTSLLSIQRVSTDISVGRAAKGFSLTMLRISESGSAFSRPFSLPHCWHFLPSMCQGGLGAPGTIAEARYALQRRLYLPAHLRPQNYIAARASCITAAYTRLLSMHQPLPPVLPPSSRAGLFTLTHPSCPVPT